MSHIDAKVTEFRHFQIDFLQSIAKLHMFIPVHPHHIPPVFLRITLDQCKIQETDHIYTLHPVEPVRIPL